jgi:hypothetical protein
MSEALSQGEEMKLIKHRESEHDTTLVVDDTYFPEYEKLCVLRTFKCPVCNDKWSYIVPAEVGDKFHLILGGVTGDDNITKALNELKEYLDMLSYMSTEEKLHLLTGICSIECEWTYMNGEQS